MNTPIRIALTFAGMTCLGGAAGAQHPAMPPGMTHEQHLAQMEKDKALKERGAEAMGFDQDATTHHFRLYSTGGAIEVVVNDDADATSRGAIREHLASIAKEFAAGTFGKPLATHGELPPGVKTMQGRLKTLTFRYEELSAGGRVVINAADAEATSAVHEFLRYQIRAHATGDPTTVSR
jgi:hypothetical protein